MRLHRLKLENFRLHADTDIEFGTGVTAIVGPNGAGKTTLFEAIAWAIYGTPAVRGSRDSIRRSNAAPRTRVRVELVFSFGAHEYRVVRELNKAELYQDNGSAPVATTQRAVTDKLGHLLGMSHTEFFNTYFTGQKELAVMAAMGPTDRGKFLSRLMGYERLRLAQDRLRVQRSSIRLAITELEQGVGSEAILEDEAREAEAGLARAKKRQSEIAKTLHAARERMSDVGPRWKAMSALRDSIRSQQGERSIAQQRVHEAKREHERLDRELTKAVAARNELAGLRGDVEGAEAMQEEFDRLDREAEAAGRKRTVSGQLDEVSEQLKVVEDRLAAVGADDDLLAAAKSALERHHEALGRARGDEERHRTSWVRDRQDAETKTSSLRDQYEDLRSHKKGILEAGSQGDCPTCARPLGDEFEAVLETVGRQMEEIESRGKFYKQRVRQLQAAPGLLREAERAHREAGKQVEQSLQALATAESRMRERQQAHADHARLCERRQTLETELKSLPHAYDANRHDEIRRLLRELQPKVQRATELAVRAERAEALVAEAEAAEGVLSECEANVAELEKAIVDSGFREEEYAALRQRHAEVEATLHDAEVKAASVDGDIKAAEVEVQAVQRRVKEREARLARLSKLKAHRAMHDELDAALEALRADLNSRLRPDLAEAASTLLADLTEGRYDELELDEQYRLTIVENGIPKPVISGGEEDIANLVLRLAISQMVAERAGQPLSLLVFDEIFGSLDEDRRRGVIALLRGLGSRFPQVVLITHIESVKDGADRILRVTLDQENGTARIKEDEEPITREDAAA